MSDEQNTSPNEEQHEQTEAETGDTEAPPEEPKPYADEKFPELAELEDEINRRIRNNQRFLERFMDEDFEEDDDGAGEDDEDPEIFEEL